MTSVVGRCRGRRSVTEAVGRWSVAEARWSNPLAPAPLLIGLRVRVCGDTVGTANVGFRAPACLTFIWRCARGAHCHKTAGAPDQGASRIEKPIRRSSREITSLTFSPLISTSYLYLDNPFIHESVHRTHCIMTVSYVLSDTMTTIQLPVSKQILV
jgi:hypothetical protein